MFKYIFQILTILIFLTSSLKSEEFENILINGNERISDETILVFSDLTNEQFLDENSINDILKKLYQSGFFKDVVVKIENKNLIIKVIENPIIQTVFIEGIKRKGTEEGGCGASCAARRERRVAQKVRRKRAPAERGSQTSLA